MTSATANSIAMRRLVGASWGKSSSRLKRRSERKVAKGRQKERRADGSVVDDSVVPSALSDRLHVHARILLHERQIQYQQGRNYMNISGSRCNGRFIFGLGGAVPCFRVSTLRVSIRRLGVRANRAV